MRCFKIIFYCLFIFFVFFVLQHPKTVYAQVCWTTRTVYQYACVNCNPADPDCKVCKTYEYKCAVDLSGCSEQNYKAGTGCQDAVYGNVGPCLKLCSVYNTGTTDCRKSNEDYVECTSAAEGCKVNQTLKDCYFDANNNACVDTSNPNTFTCWGPGGPTPTDGPTPTPGGPEPTSGGPTPTPVGPEPTPIILCPNGGCDIEETCLTCPDDCGSCPAATLTARAVEVTDATNNCLDVPASTNYLTGTVISFTPAVSPASQTQGAGILTWNNVTTDGTTVYTVQASPPESRAPGVICVSKDGGGWIQNASADLAIGGTDAFAIAYLPQKGWLQTSVGNVYAAGQLTSSIPSSATNPYFSLGLSSPGVVSYGTGYDFSLSAFDHGETQVSSTNWLVNQTLPSELFYERFIHKLGIPGTETPLPEPLIDLAKPGCSSPCILYANGNMTTRTASPWTIGATEQMILVVNGNLTINSPITITSGGFFGAFVNGNITVSPAVGTTASSTTTSLDGIYVASNSTKNAVFSTGDSSVASSERLNIAGSVIADSV